MQDDSRNKESEAYKAKVKVALKAFECGCLISCHDSGKMYTPREFMDSDEKVIIKQVDVYNMPNYTLMYPKHAIGRKLEELQEAQKEFESFIVRVLNAFDLEPVKPEKKKP
jgi:hypothetical protein